MNLSARSLVDAGLAERVAELLRTHGLSVVAEGVETRRAWDQLLEFGCDTAQGYWLGRPCPATELPALIRAAQELTAGERAAGR